MAEYANSTLASNNWGLYSVSPIYKECLVIFIVLLYGLKVQAWRFGHQRYLNMIRDFGVGVAQLLVTLEDWCTLMTDYDDIIEKDITNVRVVPYRNKTVPKPKRKEETKHPWDIAQEIITEQKQAALAVKWGY